MISIGINSEFSFDLFAKKGSGMKNGRPERADRRRANQGEGKRGDGANKNKEVRHAPKAKLPPSLRHILGRRK